jgi:cytochrome c biogenesis protein CcmG, thiol:disulfide interchange protein DsbE
VDTEVGVDTEPSVALHDAAPPEKRRLGALVGGVVVLVVLVLAMLLLQAQVAGSALPANPVGSVAPDFELSDLEGGTVRLSDLKGQPVLLNFWASWCTSCKVEAPVLERGAEEWAARDVAFLGVAVKDSKKWALEYAEESGLNYPSGIDPTGSTMRAYGVTGTPETFVIDADGVVRARWIGPLSSRTLEELLVPVAGPAPSTTTTE